MGLACIWVRHEGARGDEEEMAVRGNGDEGRYKEVDR